MPLGNYLQSWQRQQQSPLTPVVNPQERCGGCGVAESTEHPAVFAAAPLVRSLVPGAFGPGKRGGRRNRGQTLAVVRCWQVEIGLSVLPVVEFASLTFTVSVNQAISVTSRGTRREQFRDFPRWGEEFACWLISVWGRFRWQHGQVRGGGVLCWREWCCGQSGRTCP